MAMRIVGFGAEAGSCARLAWLPNAISRPARIASLLPNIESLILIEKRSAPCHAHVTAQRRAGVAPVDDEVVALRLAGDGIDDRPFEKLVAFGGAHRCPQVGGVLLAEAHEELAGAGEAHPVAAFAQNLGHWWGVGCGRP